MENEILRMELPVGSEFIIRNVKFRCIENARSSCMDCHLQTSNGEYAEVCDAIQCSAERRIDGKDVCFKKIVL